MIAEGLLFTKQHEWAKVEGNIVTMGITDYAQMLLGEIIFVELPEIGTEVVADGEIAVVESTKAANDIFSPVTGKIVSVNSALESEPELINKDCYGAGWICKLEISDDASLDSLMNAEQYKQYVKGLEQK
ncbi:MAG: glycine cleavage system protein GcvH [Planctomycetota bacterium]|jgi:glycine cleavage system H protein